MLPLHFLYRKALPDAPPIANMPRFRAEVLRKFEDQISYIEALWTSAASRNATFEACDHLVASGVMSVGRGAATREVLVENGRYFASIGGFSAASTTDELPAHRLPREGSIEDDFHRAFAMQLDRTISILIARAGGKPKRDGPAIRDALARHIEPALNISRKTGPDADRGGQIAERMKRLSHEGRVAFEALFENRDELEKERSVTHQLADNDLRDLLTEDTLAVLRREPDMGVRRELVLLVALAKLCVLARSVRGTHKAIRQAPSAQSMKGLPVEHTLLHNRYALFVRDEIVEDPRDLLPELEELAAISFSKEGLPAPFVFLHLVIDIASRYEVDVLQLFPSRAVSRPITNAVIALARCWRRGDMPQHNSHHAFFAYWGLRAIIIWEPKLEFIRKHLRSELDEVPQELMAFAIYGRQPSYNLNKTEIFIN